MGTTGTSTDGALRLVDAVGMELIGSVFAGGGKPGDFTWMITQPEYADALFIFNDNQEEFRAHQRHAPGSGRCHRGGGNAAVRPFQCQEPQRAAGIPTGASGQGYQRLDDDVRAVIDEALAAVHALLDTNRYSRVIYSAADRSGDLGTGIFSVGDDVRAYIVEGLRRVVASSEES
jgi:hypothetical protein